MLNTLSRSTTPRADDYAAATDAAATWHAVANGQAIVRQRATGFSAAIVMTRHTNAAKPARPPRGAPR